MDPSGTLVQILIHLHFHVQVMCPQNNEHLKKVNILKQMVAGQPVRKEFYLFHVVYMVTLLSYI